MRTRIYVRGERGCEEGHLDYTPPYKRHPSTVDICVGKVMKVQTSELVKAVRVLEALDDVEKGDC